MRANRVKDAKSLRARKRRRLRETLEGRKEGRRRSGGGRREEAEGERLRFFNNIGV